MDKIVLIDGHSILNRAFYGVPDLTNSEGIHTGAVYGFLNIMFMILEEEKPEYIAVAFDVHAPTFRHELFAEYKGTRSPMPPELREQVPLIQDVLRAMGITVVTLPGYEADDVLGTIAKRSQANGIEVSLVSGDRDLLQISDEHIKIRIPKTKAGKTVIENYYPADVCNEYGVTPEVFIDMKALMGDSSDNVAGVHGVGPKSAAKLLTTYGSLDGIYEHINDMKPSAQKDNLIADKESAYLSKKLVTIEINAPVDFDINSAKIGNLFNPDAYTYFKRLEFKNFLSKFDSSNTVSDASITDICRIIDNLADADAYFNGLHKFLSTDEKPVDIAINPVFASDTNKNTKESLKLLTIATMPDDIVSIIIEGFITVDYLINQIKKLAENPKVIFILYKSKVFYEICDNRLIEDKCFDIEIASYLLDPLRNEYDVSYISASFLGQMIPDEERILGKNKVISELIENEKEKVIEYSSYVVRTALLSKPVLKGRLSDEGMLSLFTDIEMPLTKVLYSMEKLGVGIVPKTLSDYSLQLGESIEVLSKRIYEACGEEFNILSPKQLGVILFEKMGLKGGKKTKTGYSTSADVLEKLKDVPIVADILEYRGVSKLKSTYADGLASFIDSNNRIHSTFNQTITATGRISSADPNLQNIPTRTELGKGLRAAFVPTDGYKYIDADYSQIELRILAHISGDEQLIEAYREGRDIHRITASKVFNTPIDEVSDIQRRNAKAVNFGIVYGISSFGLSQDLDISKKEAAEYIEQYFETFPGIKKYLDESVENAKEQGYVTTLFGRKRPIPELGSSNFMQRQFGERVAMNSPIQGTAADIMKVAMIGVYRAIEEKDLKSKLVLQVHDELLIEVYPGEETIIEDILIKEMVGAVDLKVKLEIEMHQGLNWLEAK